MLRRFILGFVLVVLCTVNVTFASVDYTTQADELKILGLFSGTDKGYELERAPKRIEGAAMLVRLLGKEVEAKDKMYPHPFKDVPGWANAHIGYMFHHKLTTGVSADRFDSDAFMTGNAYATFVLRALGYDDKIGDFKWDQALSVAVTKGIISASEMGNMEKGFKRNEMVGLSYAALGAEVKSGAISLSKQLLNDNVFSLSQIEKTTINMSAADSIVLVKTGITPNDTSVWLADKGVAFSFRKSEIRDFRSWMFAQDGSDTLVDTMIPGWTGSIQVSPQGVLEKTTVGDVWENKLLLAEIKFFNHGELVKTIKTNFYFEGSSKATMSYNLMTPEDLVDKIQVTVKAVAFDELIFTEGYSRAYKNSHQQVIDDIIRYRAASLGGSGPRPYYESLARTPEEITAHVLWQDNFSGASLYQDGRRWAPYTGSMRAGEDVKSLAVSLESTIGRSFSGSRVDQTSGALLMEFGVHIDPGSIVFINIYDENEKVVKKYFFVD